MRVCGRAIAAAAAIVVVLAGDASSSSAALPPDGPRLAYIREGEPLLGAELWTTDPLGERPLRILSTPNSNLGIADLSWSSDGIRLALGGYGFFSGDHVLVLSASDGMPRPVSGTRRGFQPVFSPDGQTIAFGRFRYRGRGKNRPPYTSISTWSVDAEGGTPSQLTPWRDGLFIAPYSFSPDGSRLAAVRQTLREGPSIVSMPVTGGRPSVIVEHGTEPEYSPDGSSLAFVRWKRRRVPRRLKPSQLYGGDLFMAAADGSSVRRLTFTPGRREESPSWDPSGQRLAYTQYPSKLTWDARVGIGSAIIEINKDGTCRHRLLFTYGLSYRAATWQLGPGRGAGPIEC